jgi:hypothetical protein
LTIATKLLVERRAKQKQWRESGSAFLQYMLSYGLVPWEAAEHIGVSEEQMRIWVRGHAPLPETIKLAVERVILKHRLKLLKTPPCVLYPFEVTGGKKAA